MTWWRGARTKGAACAPGVLALLVALAIATDARAQQKVDLELVLAVDVSSSVSDEEFHLQMTGLSAAFRHPLVVAAISQSGDWGVAVAVVQWASGDEQVLSVDWSRIRNEAEAAALSARIAEAPRLFAGGDTSLGGAIGYAAQLFEGNGFRGLRRVIDISGDGGGGYGQSLAKSIAVRGRDRALAKGITINGLAILNEDPKLDVFFRDNVIGGAGSFVITVESYRDFATAILEKLIREIGDRPLAADQSLGRRAEVRINGSSFDSGEADLERGERLLVAVKTAGLASDGFITPGEKCNAHQVKNQKKVPHPVLLPREKDRMRGAPEGRPSSTFP